MNPETTPTVVDTRTQVATSGARSLATATTRLPMAISGASSDTSESSGAASGQTRPTTPSGSGTASAAPRIGG